VKSLPSKRRIPEKWGRERGARIEKKKRWNVSWKFLVLKTKGEDEIYKLLGEILSKERKKGDHMHLHYLLFPDFSLSYPHSLHHSPSTMIICHTNSLEFSYAFTIYKV
jgi:hypothetical protein